MTNTEQPSLAERCFAEDNAKDELFETVNRILGGRPTEECTQPGYQWACVDTWVDGYDSSIEVIRGPQQPPLTREQADAILDLGFGQIYESPYDADQKSRDGTNWKRGYKGWCMPRNRGDENVRMVKALKERDHWKKAYEDEIEGNRTVALTMGGMKEGEKFREFCKRVARERDELRAAFSEAQS